ncbi:Dihydroflavonol 4-reductase [Rhynchospora pubera]|uniref:Dihydroflavonol 4-reductase n=1 Tax=Rhynchospora pubera TaxID=906938 RepID=A0AAV8EU28_9POAL|nr:Dihydroflavonol 4-reductase [Rhynchospora pubera]KAJ4784880.1 Dihydroflavonol 4-reductase [Rhynchospora pubera]
MPQAPPVYENPKPVCVMDASGALGQTLVERLLNQGYTVHAATSKQSDLNGLKKLLGEKKQLKLFRFDPFDYQSIVDAIKGCYGLFYMYEASQDQSTYDELMVEVEVRAAHNVIEACAQVETIERVVFTSSVTAVVWKENRKSSVDVNERDWSEPNFCRKYKLWHALAKTLSEKTAWALAMDRDIDMVSINAGLVTGPGLSASNPYLKGTPEMYEDGVLVTVDVDFLADAHIAVYETPCAFGRYLCFNHAVCLPEDAVKLAQLLVPKAPCPPPSDELGLKQQRIQNKKLNRIMAEFAQGTHLELYE